MLYMYVKNYIEYVFVGRPIPINRQEWVFYISVGTAVRKLPNLCNKEHLVPIVFYIEQTYQARTKFIHDNSCVAVAPKRT